MITGALIITTVIGIALIGLGISVYIRNPNNALNIHFFLFAIAVTFWLVVNYIAANPLYPHLVQLWSNRVVLIAGGLGILWMLRFVLQLTGWWTRYRSLFRNLALICSISWILCLTPLTVANVTVDKNQIVNEFGLAAILYFMALFATTIAAITAFILAHYKLKGNAKSQVDVISQSILMALPIIVFGNAVLPIMGHYGLVNYTPLMVSTIVGTMAYVIVRHKLFDIRPILARSVAYVLSLGLISILYAVVLHYISVAINTLHSGVLTNLVTITLVVIALTTYPPMKKKFDFFTNKIFYKDAYDPQNFFNALNKAHAATIDLNSLLRSSISVILDFMHTRGVSVMVENEQGARYFGVGEFDADERSMIGICRSANELGIKMLITDENGEKDENIALRLRKSGIAGVIGFGKRKSMRAEFHGYLIVGPRESGIAFSASDIQNLETVANELAIAIQNALHYEEIQRFNETLEAKVEDATRKLKVTNDKLKKIDETKDEFISMASHQLRTPLTSVKGYVSMVLDGDVGPINDQQRQLLNQSFMSSQRMANLISDLLNLSRINTGKFVIDATPLDLSAIVAEEFNQLRDMAEAKNIKFTYNAPTTFPTLMFDDGKMHQVVMNLMDNALYYTPPGGTVSVHLTEAKNKIEFRVVDSGIGVPRDAQKFLFTKMYRADNARRARPDGTGLGLFLVKKVVAEQKGAILFETVEGKGSTFGFRFNKHDHLVPEGFTAKTD